MISGGIVELKVDAKNEKHWEVEIKGADRGFPSLLAKSLQSNPDVEFAASVLEHPVVGNPKIVIKTKSKKASVALVKAIEDVEDQIKEFKSKIKKLKEKSK